MSAGLAPSEPTFSTIIEMSDEAWGGGASERPDSRVYGTRASLREMIPNRYGSIVSLSSIHALPAIPDYGG